MKVIHQKNFFSHFGAFESTKIHGSGTDVLETTRHLAKWREDLDLLRATGLHDLRYSAPWHRIERTPGEFDFSWMDQPMRHMRQHGMRPVIDLLHHTSFPDWLENGFANSEFPAAFCRYVEAFAARYEWVDRYTIFNEPLATTLLCSYTGDWYPHYRSETEFVHMGVNVCRAIRMADRSLRRIRRDFCSVYIDTCEHHSALDRRSERWVAFANDRRFWMLDLVLGQIGAKHPLAGYLASHGVSADELREFADDPVKIDVLGLDSYPHSEMEWYWSRQLKRANIGPPAPRPLGFAKVAEQYVDRYRLPVMLSETNIRGTVTDRLTWLRFMHEQCESLVNGGVDFRGFCWYPSIDSTDWCYLCTRATGTVDPQGVWYLDDERETRFPSELSMWYSQLARGLATARDLPAYRFLAPLDRELAGYQRLMAHWEDWREAEEIAA